jgi:F0F1-type ATP synthase membrane subunit b/b'
MQIKLAPDLSLLAIMVIFLLEYLIVRKFFLQPINTVIDEREQERATAEKLYEEALARFNEAASRMEAQLHVAKRDASSIRDKYRTDAAAHRNQVIEKTHADAKTVVGEAEAKLSAEVKVARERIVSESESLARIAAERILGRPV